jgi:hypothetical protein
MTKTIYIIAIYIINQYLIPNINEEQIKHNEEDRLGCIQVQIQMGLDFDQLYYKGNRETNGI